MGSETAALPRQDYLEAANGICRQLKLTLESETSASVSLNESNAFLVSSVRDAVVQLRALTPPPGDEAGAAAIYNQLDHLAAQQEALYSTEWASTEDLNKADADLVALAEASGADATEFGLSDCDLSS